MSAFKDILEGGFEAHARALPAGGGFAGDRSRVVLRSIRRRRATRAAVAAGGAVLAVGAVSVGAIALNARGPVLPGLTPPITRGLYPWCDLSTYPAVNPGALGAADYQGRLYETYTDIGFVYVAPDGTRTRLEPDANGTYRLTTPGGIELEIPDVAASADYILSVPGTSGGVITDMFMSGSTSSILNSDGPDGPSLGYEWTTVVPEAVPVGVDVEVLSDILIRSLGFAVAPHERAVAPNGSIVETVFRWHDGRQLAVRVNKREPAAPVPDYTDLASVSVRVSNLPDGGVFEITSTYDPSKTWQVACWPYRDGASPSASPGASPSASPSLSAWATPSASPGASQGGFDALPTPTPSYVTPAPSSSAPSPTP